MIGAMETSRNEELCGICGQLVDSQHVHAGVDAGERIEYVVVEIRGVTAHYQAVKNPSRTLRTGAPMLAQQLGIELSELLGRHYTCLVTPAEYGEIRSQFKLV
ncbi:hypothetical protein GCM10020229_11100 [Kitasatospora albolonga]|uniref:hypothetical protein n=1 Tax=Kitasatospora albolonga TaxID=68173 RepID=UPI0031F19F7C